MSSWTRRARVCGWIDTNVTQVARGHAGGASGRGGARHGELQPAAMTGQDRPLPTCRATHFAVEAYWLETKKGSPTMKQIARLSLLAAYLVSANACVTDHAAAPPAAHNTA